MKIKASIFSLSFLVAITTTFTSKSIQASEESEVRGMVARVFQQLKDQDYSSLYDSLPSSSKGRMTRDRFANALKRAQDMYVLDRIEIGPVRVANNLAVVDTVLYGRVVKPLDTEGKIVVQQYLVREDGKWRVATGDSGITKQFLAKNPSFARKFPIKRPRVYIKQGNNWIEFTPRRNRQAVSQARNR